MSRPDDHDGRRSTAALGSVARVWRPGLGVRLVAMALVPGAFAAFVVAIVRNPHALGDDLAALLPAPFCLLMAALVLRSRVTLTSTDVHIKNFSKVYKLMLVDVSDIRATRAGLVFTTVGGDRVVSLALASSLLGSRGDYAAYEILEIARKSRVQ